LTIDSIDLLDKFMYSNMFKNCLHKMGSGLEVYYKGINSKSYNAKKALQEVA